MERLQGPTRVWALVPGFSRTHLLLWLLQRCQKKSLKLVGTGDFPGGPVIKLEKEMATHSSILSGRILGQGSLAGYSPRGCNKLDTTEQLNTNQWLRIHLPMQGLWVRSLVGELRSHMPRGN